MKNEATDWEKIFQSPISDKVLISRVRNSQNSTIRIHITRGFPGGAAVENLPANAGDTGSSPGLGRSHMSQSN